MIHVGGLSRWSKFCFSNVVFFIHFEFIFQNLIFFDNFFSILPYIGLSCHLVLFAGFDNHTWLFHKSAISKLNSIIPVIYLKKIPIFSLKKKSFINNKWIIVYNHTWLFHKSTITKLNSR
jgi:hypothetical protein